MNKFLIALAAAVAVATPATAQNADRDGTVGVNVSGVLDRLGIDLNTHAIPNNILRILPPAAASVCNMSTSQLAYQYQQVGNMNCKAMMVSKGLKKAAKAQAVAKTAAGTVTTTTKTTVTTK